jgi:hypothetical protein
MAIRKHFLFIILAIFLFIFSLPSTATHASDFNRINRNSALALNSINVLNHCGTISSNETWTSAENVHTVGVGCSDVTISYGATVTITEGAIVKFDITKSIVVYGNLVVQGTEGNPVYFTSYRDDTIGGDTNGDGAATQPAPGDWRRIEFGDTSDDVNSLIDHAIIRYAGRDGYGAITLVQASPTIQNTTIYKGQNAAIYDPGVKSFPNLTNNTLQENGINGFAIAGAGNSTLDIDATWNITDTNTSYYLQNVVTVALGKTLTINPGVVVKFAWVRSLINNGTLKVLGTGTNPVYFTSYKDDTIGGDTNGDGWSTGSPGDWQRIEFGDTSDDINSLIDHAIIRYAGRDGYGAIRLVNASPAILSTMISDSQSAGIKMTEASPDVQDTTISGCGSAAFYDTGVKSFPTLINNTIQDNSINGYAIAGDANSTLDIDATWNITDTTYYLQNVVTVALGKTLTINPGVVVKFAWVRSLINNGTLRVLGTEANPIYFTSYKDDSIGGDTNNDGGATQPTPGDWQRIEFGDTSDDVNSLIDHAIIRYAGRDGYGAVTLVQASPTVVNTILSNNDYAGLRSSTSTPSLVCNDIYSNNSYGIANTTPAYNIVAENHWWGAVSGPYHPVLNPTGTGNRVSDGVDFIPWAPHSCVYNLPPNMPSNPNPPDGADNQPVNIILSWTGGDPDGDNVTYDVYFGIIDPPPLVSSRQQDTSFDPGILNYDDRYYWKIVAWDQLDTSTEGPLWNFYTGLTPPAAFSKLSPTNGAINQPTNLTLSWESSAGATSYEYCYDTSNNNACDGSWTNVSGNTNVDLSGLDNNTTYYWQVRAVNANPIQTYADNDIWWHFTTLNVTKFFLPIVIR